MEALFKKLNLKDHQSILILNAPEEFNDALAWLKRSYKVAEEVESSSYDFALVFVKSQADVNKSATMLYNKLSGDFVLWMAYPKGISKRYSSTVNRDNGWQPLGKLQVEPVRQVALDADWSALRFRHIDYIKKMTRSFGRLTEK